MKTILNIILNIIGGGIVATIAYLIVFHVECGMNYVAFVWGASKWVLFF
jgi:uncharacterized membrane protein YccF (DUF307 family)